MPKLAWFSPLFPVKSGIAQYSAELLPAIAENNAIDIFVDGRPSQFVSPDPRIPLFDAHDFVWKNRREAYDLVVYQLGNAVCHDYMWAYLLRYPGLVVLHDGQVHHARARMLLQQRRENDYRQEFWFSHPDAREDLAELGVAGLLGSMTYLFPMLRPVVESSRRLLVHNDWLAEQIREMYPNIPVNVVEMGVRQPTPHPEARRDIRVRHNIAADAVVFTALGRVTPEKRIREALRALAACGGTVSGAHVLLAGETVDYYDLRAEVEAAGLERIVTMVGYIPDDAVDDYLAASDVCLCMRWPTCRETSASWRRCVAAGKPTISTDLLHTVNMPMLDPRDWSVLTTERPASAVGVGIDIVDEVHSLTLAIRRLATDARLRDTLGVNAQALWSDKMRLEQMATGYEHVIASALTASTPNASMPLAFPRHLRSTGLEHTEQLLCESQLPADALAELATSNCL
jgi:glycosyltransferase involved in cell wall biosynthesis